MIREETEKDHLLNPIFRDYDGHVIPQHAVVYKKDHNQRVTDYTKNISQSIFSPGELLHYKVVNRDSKLSDIKKRVAQQEMQMSAYGRNQPVNAIKRTKSAQPTMCKLRNFANQLNEEAKRKNRLRAQIEEIKSNLSVYQASMAASNI